MLPFASTDAPIVMRFGALGDMVMLVPMLNWLAATTGAPVDIIGSGGWTKPLLSGVDSVNQLHLLSSRKTPYLFNRSQQELVQWLKTQHPRPVIICETEPKSRWLVERAGYGPDEMFWAGDLPIQAGEHWVQRWLRLACLCYGQRWEPGIAHTYTHQGWLPASGAAREDFQQWVQARGWQQAELLLIQPGNKRTMRRGRAERQSNPKFWPDDYWVAVAQWLCTQHPQAQVLFCGSPEEAEYIDRLSAACNHPRVHNLARDLPIPRLLALLEKAQGLISVDTGPAHAAAAAGCPTVVLFADKDPALWQPYTGPAAVIPLQASSQSMADISVAEVQQAWQQLSLSTAGHG
nr:glycosyltransferase family 9 protein [Oceanococcus sp. HetDA_MAG_MS8]